MFTYLNILCSESDNENKKRTHYSINLHSFDDGLETRGRQLYIFHFPGTLNFRKVCNFPLCIRIKLLILSPLGDFLPELAIWMEKSVKHMVFWN